MLTVVIATCNRAELLFKTLRSIAKLDTPQDGWKLIVIDNNSSDQTQSVIELFQEDLPIQSLFQKKKGKNQALNIAIPHFEGELIIFTDDDVIPDRNWLTSYENIMAQHKRCDYFGGLIVPEWPRSEPEAILRSIPLSPAFAIHPEDLDDGHNNPGLFWGANLAIRKRVFDQGFKFNVSIGPTSGKYIMGSETEFIQRLDRNGFSGWFSTNIVVKHMIQAEQLTKDWLFNRAKKYGKKVGYTERLRYPYKRFENWRFNLLIKNLVDLFVSKVKKNEVEQLSALWNIGFNYAVLKMLIFEKEQ